MPRVEVAPGKYVNARTACMIREVQRITRRPVLAVHVRGTDKVEEDPAANDWNHRLAALAPCFSGSTRSALLAPWGGSHSWC